MFRRILARLRALQQSWILFTFFRCPTSPRDAFSRALVLAAVAAAIITPIFIGRGGGDVTAGAGAAFTAQLAELAALEEQRDREGGSADLDARIAALEEQTRLGYLERDGDASDRGALAPDFRLLTLNGDPLVLSQLDGPVVLNFWASWCEPCIEEMPDFELVHQELQGRVTFLGVNDGESPETAREFADIVTGVTYPILLDPTKSMTNGPYPLVGRPTTFFIGADGIIQDLRVGIVDLETLRGLVGDLIGEDVSRLEDDAAPAAYGDAALGIIASARANFATADALFARWREDETVLTDPGFQRNLEAQTIVWSDLAEQFAALSPPELWSDLHQRVSDTLANLANAAGPLVREAVADASQSGLQTAATLYDSFRARFTIEADNLSGVLATQLEDE